MTSVLVTRPEAQAEPFCMLLEEYGLTPIRFPLLAIEPIPDAVDRWLSIGSYLKIDWLIFISVNAVNYGLSALQGRLPDALRDCQVAAIGKATANALAQHGLSVDVMPTQGFTSETMLALPEFQQLDGLRMLCVRGEGGRELLAETLRQRGAQVHFWEVYRRCPSSADPNYLCELIVQNAIDVIAITSGEALKVLVDKVAVSDLCLSLFAIPLVVVSDRIGLQAKSLGFEQVVVSENASDTAVLQRIISIVSGENSG